MNRSYISYLLIRAFTSAVSTISSVALGWHIYKITGDPFSLAMIGLVQITPILSLFIVSGLVVDRFPRRIVIACCVGSEAFFFSAIAYLMSQPEVMVNAVYCVLFFIGCSRAFYRPAQDAILPSIVTKDYFPKAVSINAVVFNVALTLGPFLAGYMLAWFDRGIYMVLAFFPAVSFGLVWMLPVLKQLKPSGRGIAQVLGGVNFIRRNPIVLGSISLDLFIVMMGSVMALLPVYAADVLHLGPEGLGLLRGMPALGAVMVGLLMTRYPPKKNVGTLLFISLVVFALSIIVFAYSSVLWLSLIALWIYGGSDMVSVNVRSALVQLATPDELRGRVNAVNSIFIASSNQLGDFRSGSMASLFSPVATVALGGVMALGVVVFGAFAFPQIRKFDRFEDVDNKD